MYEVGDYIDYSLVIWESDWNGYEVGFPELDVVGLYSDRDGVHMYYVDIEDGTIVEVWVLGDYEGDLL